MATTVQRINGSKTQVGTLYNLNSNLYIITVIGASAIDLTAEDSLGTSPTNTITVDGVSVGNILIDGVVEAIVKEINPLAFFVPNANAGKIYVVMDQSIDSASELQTRIRRIGLNAAGTATTVGPNAINIIGSTVAVPSTITFA